MFILKQLRREKKMRQKDLAKEIGVSLRTIQLYERKKANIPIKNLTKISEFFNLSIAELYMYENRAQEDGEPYVFNSAPLKNGNRIKSLGQKRKLLMAPLLFHEQYGEYIEKIMDSAFLEEQICVGFIMEYLEDVSYVAFEIFGNAMDDGTIEAIPNKSIVLGKEIGKEKVLATIENGKNLFAVIVCKDRVLCKKILGYNKEMKSILCHNLNDSPEYTDFEIPLHDVLQVYEIVKKQIG